MTTRGRLALAALVSVALHGLVVSSAWVPLPSGPGEGRPLLARLALPVAAPAVPKPQAKAPRRPVPAPAPVVAAAAAVPPTDALPAVPEQTEVAPEQPAAPEQPQQLALAAESTAAVAHSLPRRGRITYTLLYGNDRSYIGKVVQTWEVSDTTYRLSSEAETGGLIELFRPQRLRYVSQGRITREGLRPESFEMNRTRRGQNEAAQARFDWGEGSLAYGRAREPKNAPLPSGTQDFMSFIYQYAVLPPAPGRFQVAITTGTRFDTYEVEVAAEESIETPLGTLRALPVRQLPRPGAESIQIWLAADYRYLPVRIRHYDRQGNFSGEQVVSEIRISEE